MENQYTIDPADTSSINSMPANLSPVSLQRKTNLLLPIVISVFISVIVFGTAGYYLGMKKEGVKSNKSNSVQPTSFPRDTEPTATPNFDKVGKGRVESNTYTNEEIGFTFTTPLNVYIDNSVDGVIEIKTNPNQSNDENAIQVDINTSFNNTYQDAIQSSKDNLENPKVTNLTDGVLYVGLQKPGQGGGVMTKNAIFNTKYFPTVVTLVGGSPLEITAFSQIVSSFKLIK